MDDRGKIAIKIFYMCIIVQLFLHDCSCVTFFQVHNCIEKDPVVFLRCTITHKVVGI